MYMKNKRNNFTCDFNKIILLLNWSQLLKQPKININKITRQSVRELSIMLNDNRLLYPTQQTRSTAKGRMYEVLAFSYHLF